ncbi:MAG TPA: DUF1405 domain-containing protein [Anaerolineae bacterium]
METIRFEGDRSQARTVSQHSYSTPRSFDLPLVATADPVQGGCNRGAGAAASGLADAQMQAARTLIRAWTDTLIANTLLVYGLAGLNIAGFVAGTLFWYGDFIRASNPPLWAYPFIPDSPLSTLLNRFAIAYNIKFGAWTMLFWSLYWARTGDMNPLSVLMFTTHFGMAAEGVLLFQYLDGKGMRNTFTVMAWFALHDIVDYAPIAPGREGYGWYPPLPMGTALTPIMMAFAIVMTCALSGSLILQSQLSRRKAVEAWRRRHPLQYRDL